MYFKVMRSQTLAGFNQQTGKKHRLPKKGHVLIFSNQLESPKLTKSLPHKITVKSTEQYKKLNL